MRMPIIANVEDTIKSIRGKVLLINPPVFDSRYPWIKWNQPLDLLKLASRLAIDNNCEIKIFDFMIPSSSGKVSKLGLPKQDNENNNFTKYHFGKSWKEFEQFLDGLAEKRWIPENILISTLTSFWWQSVPLVSVRIKNYLKDSKIIVGGNYPRYEHEHAKAFCFNTDIITQGNLDLNGWEPNFEIYPRGVLSFLALDVNEPGIVRVIEKAISNGIVHFTFYNENVFLNFENVLRPLLEEIVEKQLKIFIHGICGINVWDFPINHIDLLIKANFRELHFEPTYSYGGIIDEYSYRNVMEACARTGLIRKRGGGWESTDNVISGFMWIGRPDDQIETLIYNAIKILQLTGMVIPKPFTPLPGSSEYILLKDKVGDIPPEDISPHRLPFAQINGISKSEYAELYRLTAFLNMKVRGHTYDFFAENYLAKMFRKSLKEKKWAPKDESIID